jgi:LPXTG-motif cell wall-anchored protein
LKAVVRIALYPAVGLSHAAVKGQKDIILVIIGFVFLLGVVLVKKRKG